MLGNSLWQSFPVIIALETSINAALSNRASALHAILQSKHAALLNAGYVKAARTSFEYQQRIVNGPVYGELYSVVLWRILTLKWM